MLSLETVLPDRALNGFTLTNGNSNHLPMAAEALETLGRVDGLPKLIAVEGRGVKPLPAGAPAGFAAIAGQPLADDPAHAGHQSGDARQLLRPGRGTQLHQAA